MYLYLVQHGRAMSKEQDPERPLSDEGRADVRKITSFLYSGVGLDVARIYESGKLRATQTAEIIGSALNVSVLKEEGLSPLDNPGAWAEKLKDIKEDTMLVGHLPHLGKLASLLLSGSLSGSLSGAPKVDILEFSPGGVLCLKRDDTAWTVQWMVIPEILR